MNQAIGVVMDLHGWSEHEARERLDFAAGHAHTSRSDVARMILFLDT